MLCSKSLEDFTLEELARNKQAAQTVLSSAETHTIPWEREAYLGYKAKSNPFITKYAHLSQTMLTDLMYSLQMHQFDLADEQWRDTPDDQLHTIAVHHALIDWRAFVESCDEGRKADVMLADRVAAEQAKGFAGRLHTSTSSMDWLVSMLPCYVCCWEPHAGCAK